jgi:hypothetical protein
LFALGIVRIVRLILTLKRIKWPSGPVFLKLDSDRLVSNSAFRRDLGSKGLRKDFFLPNDKGVGNMWPEQIVEPRHPGAFFEGHGRSSSQSRQELQKCQMVGESQFESQGTYFSYARRPLVTTHNEIAVRIRSII